GKIRVVLEQNLGCLPRLDVQLLIAHGIGDFERRFPTLLLTKEISHSPQPQVGTGNLEAVISFDEDSQPPVCLFADVAEQNAIRRFRAAADPATQLMELRQPEALGVFDEHHRRIGDVYAHFDHGGGDEDIYFSIAERAHDLFALVGGNAAVNKRDHPASKGTG